MKKILVGVTFVFLAVSLFGCFLPGGGNADIEDLVALFVWAFDVDNSKMVHFNADASSGDIAFYSWEFGDGSSTISDDNKTTHEYGFFGDHAVRLVVTDVSGNTSEYSRVVHVNPYLPVACLDLTMLEEIGNQSGSRVRATFTAECSYADGVVELAKWWFGDGTGTEGDWVDKMEVKKTYQAEDFYEVTVEIIDEHGNSSTITKTFNIERKDWDRDDEEDGLG